MTCPALDIDVTATGIDDDARTAPTFQAGSPGWLYLDLLKKCLTRSIFHDTALKVDRNWIRGALDPALFERVDHFLSSNQYEVVKRCEYNASERHDGRDWPAEAETMAGTLRIESLQRLVLDVLRDRIPGDLIETGVWRGGCSILMRGILKAWGDTTRTVWVADSFQGLPRPDTDRFPEDEGDMLWREAGLAIPLESVQGNFAKYGLLDKQVRFIWGWFRDTLPTAPVERLALMRLDGDMYESTIVALESLYPKLSPGGYVIIDDYALRPCRKAVHDFRTRYCIADPIQTIDWTGVFWRRSR
jgi:O-methyltransferase